MINVAGLLEHVTLSISDYDSGQIFLFLSRLPNRLRTHPVSYRTRISGSLSKDRTAKAQEFVVHLTVEQRSAMHVVFAPPSLLLNLSLKQEQNAVPSVLPMTLHSANQERSRLLRNV